MNQKQNLTNDNFWDNFWQSLKLPALIDQNIQWQFALSNVFQKFLPQNSCLKLFEIGCAPGRWLIWFNKTGGYKVAGCDISSHGMKTTEKNLKMNRVEAELYQADLMSDDLPKNSFDVILSLGVIEHFTNPDQIVARHLELLKPSGKLVLEVPNMAGWLNYKLLRMAKMNDLLNVHNLGVMNKEYFISVATKFNLNIEFLDYVGGFDIGMVANNHSYKSRWKRPIILYILGFANKLFCLIPLIPKLLTRYNASFYSNMLLGIFTKPMSQQ